MHNVTSENRLYPRSPPTPPSPPTKTGAAALKLPFMVWVSLEDGSNVVRAYKARKRRQHFTELTSYPFCRRAI